MEREEVLQKSLDKPNLDELKHFAEQLASETQGNQLLLLIGDLGSGKTQFSRYFISALGGQDIMSPSFAIENQYKLEDKSLHHFDLYRLEDDGEVESSGLWDSFLPGDVVLVEWADRIDFKHWPVDWNILKLEFSLDHSVKLTHYAALA